MGKTLLEIFIEKALREYVEPERAGTPRGEPIGMSKKKFNASLLAVTTDNLNVVATNLNVSYGVLKKWRTEDRFKLQAQFHIVELAEIICAFIKHHVDKNEIAPLIALRDHNRYCEQIFERIIYRLNGFVSAPDFKNNEFMFSPDVKCPPVLFKCIESFKNRLIIVGTKIATTPGLKPDIQLEILKTLTAVNILFPRKVG